MGYYRCYIRYICYICYRGAQWERVMPETYEDTACYKLPNIQIDVARLVEDYNAIAGGEWINQNRYRSDVTNWKGISLYSLKSASLTQ